MWELQWLCRDNSPDLVYRIRRSAGDKKLGLGLGLELELGLGLGLERVGLCLVTP